MKHAWIAFWAAFVLLAVPQTVLAKKAKATKIKKKAGKKASKKKKPAQFIAILDFEEHGKIAKGSGKTLARVLYSSLNSRRYKLLDPGLVRQIVLRYRGRHGGVSPQLLKALKAAGVRFAITGSVSYLYKTFSVTYRSLAMNGRVMHSELLPPNTSWGGLVTNLQYSVRLLMRRTSKGKRSYKRRLRKKKRKSKKKKKKSRLKTFAKLTKETKKLKGLFPIYVKDLGDGKKDFLVEIHPKQLNKVFLFSPTLEGGTGGYVLTFAMLREFPFYLTRSHGKLHLSEKNVNFRIDPKKALARVFKRSFTDSRRASVKILSQPHPKTGAFLVKFKSLFARNYTSLSFYVGRRRRALRFSGRTAEMYLLKNYPKNVELGLKVFASFRDMFAIKPPGRAELKIRYSISTLPSKGYRPRLADDRVGHFLMVAKDFSSDNVDTRFVRYITRWRLEKKFPNKKVSAPKKAITYWLENGIPLPYRAAVRKGVLLWNNAFERAGFKNAIVVKQQPNNAKFDAADVRYSMIRWFAGNNVGFAQGPSRIDPMTGEIYDADIRVGADMVMYLNNQFKYFAQPLSWAPGDRLLQIFNPSARGQSLKSLENFLKRMDKVNHRRHRHHRHATGVQRERCDFAVGAAKQAALGWHLLNARGELRPGSAKAKKFINDFLIGLIAHEVGHTLGLRHNFKASTLLNQKQLGNAALSRKRGLTNSMMEYTPINLAAKGQKQGEYWQTSLGPYDYWAIEYAYKPIKSKTIQGEKKELSKIASRVSQPHLAYGTDEDAFGSASPYSVDPTVNRWDLGKDPLKYYRDRLNIASELRKRLENKLSKKYSYQRTRRLFTSGISIKFRAGLQATKYIGGLYHVRDHVGDKGNRLPFTPVPASKQREALQFLVKHYFGPQTTKLSPALVNKLAPNRLRGFSWYKIWRMRLDYPINRMLLISRLYPMYRMMHPVVLGRVADTRKRLATGADYLSLSELMNTMTQAVWAELYSPSTKPAKAKKTDALNQMDNPRRALQWFYTQLLVLYSNYRYSTNMDVAVLARAQLVQLKGKLKSAMSRAKGVNKAHLQNTYARIKEVLKARLIRLR